MDPHNGFSLYLLPALKPLLRLADLRFDVVQLCFYLSEKGSRRPERHCRQLLKPPYFPHVTWVSSYGLEIDVIVCLSPLSSLSHVSFSH